MHLSDKKPSSSSTVCDPRFWLLGTLPLFLFAAGCGSDCVHWLPDSSGFLLEDRGTVQLYSLEKPASRTVIAATGSGSAVTALRPDGKEIVAVEQTGTEERPSLRLVLYALDGRQTHRSEVLPFASRSLADAQLFPSTISWSPGGERVIISGETQADGVAVYDLARNTFKVTAGIGLFSILCSPVRPDGKGFIAVREVQGKPASVFFTDWDGWEYSLADKNGGLEDLTDLMQSQNVSDVGMFGCYMAGMRWEGAKLILRITTADVAEFDTEERVVVLQKAALTALAASDPGSGPPADAHAFPDGNTILRIRLTEGHQTLELFQMEQNRTKPLTLSGKDAVLVLFPSPDGKSVAVGETGENGVRVYVVDESGNLKPIRKSRSIFNSRQSNRRRRRTYTAASATDSFFRS